MWVGVITNAGAVLLNQWALGGSLEITRAVTGTGTVAAASMMAQTALVTQKQTASIISYNWLSSGLKIKLQVTAPAAGYTLNQVGVYASLSSGTEVLLALYQNSDGVAIPSSSDSPDFIYTMNALLSISNSGQLTVTLDPGAVISHTHTKSDISDFSHSHVKADITDFSHEHTVSEISDFPATMPPSAHTHAAGDITSGTLDSARLPTVPLTKGGTGQTTAAKGLYALINGATAITAASVADTDYICLDDVSATTGKKMLVSELKKLTAPLSGTASCPAASSWSLNSTTGLYYVTVSLTGVLATHKLHLTPTIDTSDTATGEAQQEAWDTHYYAESVAGGVTFYATEAPTVAVTFTWEAVL